MMGIGKIRTALAAVVFLISVSAQSQSLKEQIGDKYFDQMLYVDAVEVYESAYKKEPDNVGLTRKIASCYRLLESYVNAEEWYGKLIAGSPELNDHYYYAQVLKSNGKYEESNKEMALFISKGGKSEVFDNHLKDKRYYEKLKENADKYTITLAPFNSPATDFAPHLLGKDEIVFASNRSESKKKKPEFFLSSFKASIKKESSEATPFLKKEMFSKSHHAPVWVSKDGKKAFMTVSQEKVKKDKEVETRKVYLQIYELNLTEKGWEKGEPFPYNSLEYSVGNPSLNAKGDTMYFTSDMPGGMGETDIWFSVYQNNMWTKPQNPGKLINTEGKDMFPYVDAKGNLFFASDGHVGLGGLDIFVAYRDGKSLQAPVNMGYPVNTRFDDFGWAAIDQFNAYFASRRDGGAGDDDIYHVNIAQPVPEPDLRYLLTCLVKDATTGKEIDNPKVRIYDVTAGKVDLTDSLKSDLSITLKKENSYSIEVEKDGYLAGSASVAADSSLPDIVNKTIELKQEGIRLEDVLFDYRQAKLTDKAKKQLDELAAILQERPAMKIEMGAHTDSRGSYNYNIKLSQRRANSVVKYLTSKGIDDNRMQSVGYGETQHVNGCNDGVECSEEQHHKNRRVAFNIVTEHSPEFLASAPPANGQGGVGGNTSWSRISGINHSSTPKDGAGISYMVQILMSNKPKSKSDRRFKKLSEEVKVYEHKGWYKYVSGAFSTKAAAREYRLVCIQHGFTGAFVVQFKDSSRIN